MVDSRDRYAVLENEPASRLPVCVLVDKSYSMNAVSGGKATGRQVVRDGQTWNIVTDGGATRMDSLLTALTGFVDDIQSDLRARASVEMAIVSFGEDIAIERDFGPVDDSIRNLKIKATGDQTRLGQAVRAALSLLDRRKADYREYAIDYYQPQLIVLTDGDATDPGVCDAVAPDVQARFAEQKLLCLPFLIGRESGLRYLRKFGPKGQVFQVDSANLTALFRYLSQSHIRLSQSQAGGTDSNSELAKMLQGLTSITTRLDDI